MSKKIGVAEVKKHFSAVISEVSLQATQGIFQKFPDLKWKIGYMKRMRVKVENKTVPFSLRFTPYA